MSGMMNPIGIITGPMAEYFNQPITRITANFSWFTGGIFVGSLAALIIYEWASLKFALLVIYGLILLSLISLPYQSDLPGIWLALGLVGACCGAGLSGAAITISKSYEQERRASMLVITDGCFSVAGIITSWLAVQLLTRNIQWYGTYLFIAVITCIIIALTSLSTFPDRQAEKRFQEGPVRESWPIGTWICIFALFIYTLSQYSLFLWLPNYAETQLGATLEEAGLIVSRFWSGMLVAQIFSAWWVFKIGVRRMVFIGTLASALATVPLWGCRDIDGLVYFAFVCGVVNLGLLKVTLSFATQIMRMPPPRLVSALLLGATTGTSVAPWVSSQIVEASNNYVVLMAASAGYFIVLVLVTLAIKLSPERSVGNVQERPMQAPTQR